MRSRLHQIRDLVFILKAYAWSDLQLAFIVSARYGWVPEDKLDLCDLSERDAADFTDFLVGLDMQGKVRFFNKDTGYGRITGDDGRDYYVHYASITAHPQTLATGQTVQFETQELSRGPEAVEVKALG